MNIRTLTRYWDEAPLNIKFTLLASLVLVALATALTALYIWQSRNTFEIELQNQADLLLDTLAHTSREPLYYLAIDELNAVASVVAANDNITLVRVYNTQGDLLVDSIKPETASSETNGTLGQLLVNFDPDDVYVDRRDDQLVAGRVVTVGRERLGAVVVGLSTQPLARQVSAVRNGSILVAVIVITLGSALALVFTRQITGPLRELRLAATQMAEGDLSVRVDVGNGGPEVNSLADAFNQMAGTVQQRDQQLSEANQSLEQRVQERTESLSDANAKLRRAHEFFRLTLDHMLESLERGGTSLELRNYLQQSKLEMDRSDRR